MCFVQIDYPVNVHGCFKVPNRFPIWKTKQNKKKNNNCSLFYLQTVSQKFFKAPQGVSPAGVCLTTTTVFSCVNSNVGLPEECHDIKEYATNLQAA